MRADCAVDEELRRGEWKGCEQGKAMHAGALASQKWAFTFHNLAELRAGEQTNKWLFCAFLSRYVSIHLLIYDYLGRI